MQTSVPFHWMKACGLGMSGEEIVPPDEVLEQMDAQQKQQQQNPQQMALQQHVEQGVQGGVKMGVQRIATELTAGILATRAGMPEGTPVHIGTPAAQPGMGVPAGPGGPGGPPMPGPARPGGPGAARAAAAQGNQPGALTRGGMGPTSGTVTGNMPGPGAKPLSPGVG